MGLIFSPLRLAGAYLVDLDLREDNRGAFARTYCREEFAQIGFEKTFVQANQSWNTRAGTLRGMHYQQPPFAETKLIRCIAGAVHDVIVDLRAGSPTFLEHCAVELSSANKCSLLVPEGFAHGFVTLLDDTQLLYQHTALYAPGYEGGLHYADPRLAIAWPITPTIFSEKDPLYPFIDDSFKGLSF